MARFVSQVYTFGSNCNGQLGVGDTARRVGPQRVRLPSNAARVEQAIAGANHCVLRLASGELVTFGAYRAGQLGRRASSSVTNDAECRHWFARPMLVEGYGPSSARIATWIGAGGDRTFVRVGERFECERRSSGGALAELPPSFYAS